MVAGTTQSLGPLVIVVLGAIGTFATFLLEHPKGKYGDEIPSIKQDRLNDVCNALGPIISSAYEFSRDGDDTAHEDLDEDTKAAVAANEAVSPPDHLPPLKDAVDAFYVPQNTFQRCRQVYFGCYACFVASVIAGAVTYGIGVFDPTVPAGSTLAAVSIWIAVLAVVIGISLIFYFIRLNSKLDSMTEQANFSLD